MWKNVSIIAKGKVSSHENFTYVGVVARRCFTK